MVYKIIFPVIELIDRLAIAEVKFKRTGANEEELTYYMNQAIHFDLTDVIELYADLIKIHNQIWDLESELKTGREAELPLEEIGRRAIAIRDHNNKRIAIKNAIAEQLDCPVREIKQDHLSE
jgi:hypothetical protein